MQNDTSEDIQKKDERRLREMHPLYAKVSGAVLWELFLECGCSEEACGEQLDACLAEMRDILQVMKELETNTALGYVYTVVSGGKPCESCEKFVGKKVLGADFSFLPPFAIGCALRCRPLYKDDANVERITASPPQHGFCCPRLSFPHPCSTENSPCPTEK